MVNSAAQQSALSTTYCGRSLTSCTDNNHHSFSGLQPKPPGAGLSLGLLQPAGKVSVQMLMVYVNAMGGKLRFTILMSWFLLVELCRVGATVWLSYWTGIADKPGACVLQTTVFACAGPALLTTLLCMCSGICLCRSCVLNAYACFDKAHVFLLCEMPHQWLFQLCPKFGTRLTC